MRWRSAEGPAVSEVVPPWETRPQNLLCPAFPELWAERHRVMAHFARKAQARGEACARSTRGTHHTGL